MYCRTARRLAQQKDRRKKLSTVDFYRTVTEGELGRVLKADILELQEGYEQYLDEVLQQFLGKKFEGTLKEKEEMIDSIFLAAEEGSLDKETAGRVERWIDEILANESLSEEYRESVEERLGKVIRNIRKGESND